MKSSSEETDNNDEATESKHVFNLRKRQVPRIATPHMGKSEDELETTLSNGDFFTDDPPETSNGKIETIFMYFVWIVVYSVIIFWIVFSMLSVIGLVVGHKLMKERLVGFLNDPMAFFS